MKLNISFAASSCQKLIGGHDDGKLRTFYEAEMAAEEAALGEG